MYFINYGQMNLRIYKFERMLLVGTASNWKQLPMVFDIANIKVWFKKKKKKKENDKVKDTKILPFGS